MQQQQRQKQLQSFSSQAAKGGYVTGVRVIVSIEFMLAGKTTIYDYIYYLAENQISVACTTCASFLVYVGMYSYSYIEPITAYVIDSPCQSAKVYKEEECDGYMCYGEYAAGFLFSTCPATQYHTEKMWIPMLPGYSSSATLRKPGCNSDGRTVAHHGSSTVPTYSIGGYVMSPSGLTQFDPYVVSVSLSSLASPRSGTETSFILELSFRNFIARTLSATKESYSSYYGSVFSPSIVDIEIDITSGLGAIVTDLSYIAVGHTLIPFSAPFTEANEATIYSIALRQKRSNTEYVFRVNLGYHIFNHNAANPITLRFLATAVSTLTAYAATTLSVSARPGAYYTYNGYQEWHFYGCGNYAGNTRIYTPAQLELTVEGFLRTGTSGSNHILTTAFTTWYSAGVESLFSIVDGVRGTIRFCDSSPVLFSASSAITNSGCSTVSAATTRFVFSCSASATLGSGKVQLNITNVLSPLGIANPSIPGYCLMIHLTSQATTGNPVTVATSLAAPIIAKMHSMTYSYTPSSLVLTPVSGDFTQVVSTFAGTFNIEAGEILSHSLF